MRSVHFLLLALYAAILVGFSQYLFVSDSEFWSWNVAYNISRTVHHDWFWDRPLFYLLLSMVRIFNLNVWQTLLAARAEAALWCCLTVAMTSFICILLTKRRLFGLLSAMLLMSNPTFVAQAYRLRSDMLVTCFLLLGLFVWVRHPKHWRWALVISLFSLLISPKAIFFGLPFWLLLLWRFRFPMAILLGLVALTLPFSEFFMRHWHYLLEAIHGSSTHSRRHLWLQSLDNWWFWLGLIVLVGIQLGRRRKWLPSELVAMLSLPYYTLFLLVYPEPSQFFIAALMPIFVLIFVTLWSELPSFSRKMQSVLLVGLFAMSLIVPAKWLFHRYESINLSQQLAFFQAVDSYADEHHFAEVYDAVGAFPHRAKRFLYLGPNQSEVNSQTAKVLELDLPEILIVNLRLRFMGPDLDRLLNKYWEVHPGVFVKMAVYNSGQFDNARYVKVARVASWLARHRFTLNKENNIWVRTWDVKRNYGLTESKLSLLDALVLPQSQTLTPIYMFPESLANLGSHPAGQIYAVDF